MRGMPTRIISRHSTAIPSPTHQHLIVGSCPFHIWNHTGIKLPYQVLQLKKAHKTEPAKDSAYIKDITLFHKALCPRNLHNKAKMYGTLDVSEHDSLVFVQLFYKKNWLHWYCSRAFTLGSNLWKTRQRESSTWLLGWILDPRLWQCTWH